MQNIVEITTEEYKELIIKAYKYDKLREICVSSGGFLTTKEELFYDITEEEKKAMEERSNN